MQLFISTENQKCDLVCKNSFRRNCHIDFSVLLSRHNIDAVFPADVELSDGFADPFLWYLYFKNGMRIINLDVIPNVVGGIPNRSPLCHLFFRVNDLVRSVAQKEFCLYITLGAGHN